LQVPEKTSRRRWISSPWLWGAFVLLLLVFAGVGALLWFLSGDLTPLARHALKTSLPGADVDVQDVRMDVPGELQFSNLVIKDPITGRELVRLERGKAAFTFEDIARRQIGELRLENPLVRISPGWSGVLPAVEVEKPGGTPTVIRRIVCDYGEVVYEGEGKPIVRGKFCLDWKDFSSVKEEAVELVLWDVQVQAPDQRLPFLVIDLIRASGSPLEMFGNFELRSLDLKGGLLAIGPALESISSAKSASVAQGDAGASSLWRIGSLRISDVKTFLGNNAWQDEGDATFVLNTTLADLSPAEMTRELGGTIQEVELADIIVPSPRDPFTEVLTLRSIFLKFTLAGILRSELEEVKILHPVIHVGEDLFLYMEDAKKRFGGDETGSKAEGKGWKIRQFEVAFGSLVIGSSGRRQYGLPLNFYTTAENVALDDLASLSIKGGLQIPALEYNFPTYQLELQTKPGELLFSYPPESGVENIVGTVGIKKLRWQQYTADDAWVSATFDRSGINASFGASIYSGIVEGGLSFFFEDTSPWIGWFSGTRVDLRQLTDVIAPENFSLTGPLDLVLQTNARASDVQRVEGTYSAPNAGRMEIRKIDDLLARIPEEWSGLKKSAMRIALENLRDFDYDNGGGAFSFAGGQGIIDLKLQGPLGSRKFTANLYTSGSSKNPKRNPTSP
jgi:hypothetical protein